MGVCERNALVARNRWTRVHDLEHARIRTDEQAMCMKAALCGFLAGDGRVTHQNNNGVHHWALGIFPDDMMMLSMCVHILESVYAKTPYITKKNKFHLLQLTSRVVVEDLQEIGTYDTHGWRIPEWIMNDKLCLISWIKGFFSAEAYVGHKTIRVQTVNQKGMSQLSRALSSLSIKHNCHTYQPRQKTYSTVYIIIIAREAERSKYARQIGFWHEKKTRALNKALHSKTNA